ncbi:MAG: preprotein translocase subunit SecG [Candidatus Nomurabacteria bacterium]|nr:preprotein translocase subunit SecG [Candidatus Nomurabacteria bacterium]
MQLVANILPYAQIILSVVLVTAILLQQSGAGLGGALGGSDSDSFHHTRRGFERFLFYLSIVCGILFTLSAFLAILIKAKS